MWVTAEDSNPGRRRAKHYCLNHILAYKRSLIQRLLCTRVPAEDSNPGQRRANNLLLNHWAKSSTISGHWYQGSYVHKSLPRIRTQVHGLPTIRSNHYAKSLPISGHWYKGFYVREFLPRIRTQVNGVPTILTTTGYAKSLPINGHWYHCKVLMYVSPCWGFEPRSTACQ
jgi:hypothetical protein